MQILLVEDNPGDIRLLREYLKEGSACRLQITQTGRLSMGLERLAEARFDAVLLDLSLPDSQGLDTLVRLHEAAKDVPIIVLTGIEDEALGVRLIQADAQDYLVKAPRSKLRGITELKHSELPEIFPRLPLPLHIPFDGLPVCSLPYPGHRVSVGPKLPAPPYPFHRRFSAKDLPRRDALEYLHTSTWRYFRMRTAEQMEGILVRPDRFHFDRKPFRNFGSRLLDNHRHRRIQQRLPVFHGKDTVVVDLPRTVRSLSDCIVPLVRHTPEGTRKDCPRSKLRGITS
jgi:CheY-like chemotaxis protein